MATYRILVVDDEKDMLMLLKRSLAPELDCTVEIAESGEAALKILTGNDIDLVLADIKMPGMDGIELLQLIKKNYPDMTVVMMTAYGGIETAVEAMKQGAYDFITKPFDHDALVIRLEKALERSYLIRENRRLQMECRTDNNPGNFVGKSAAMQKVYATIETVAKTDLTVLITGPSGTGKELAAKAIHAASPRAKGPFVALNCPTLPETILESELFGYKKGAFTHASHNKIGLFQEAQGGTIFLDEIGDISPTIQTKLLRVLQEKEIKPLGDTKSIPVDVRIITSTNQDLAEKIKKGEFREDFFYRLNVISVKMPPLEERKDDIPLIVNHFLEKHCKKLGTPHKTISAGLMQILMNRHWEGNIRELENTIIQAILFSPQDEIRTVDVEITPSKTLPLTESSNSWTTLPYKEAKEKVLKEFTQDYFGRLLMEHDGNITQAAHSCGLERQTLQQIMKRHGVSAEDYRSTKS